MALPVEVRGVLDALGSSQDAAGDLDIADIVLGDRTFVFPLPAAYEVTLTNAGSGLVGGGTVSAIARAYCVRCLCEHDVDVTGDVEAFYVNPGREDSLPGEQEAEFIENDTVDIEPAITQALVLALPYAPVHSPDCRGLCPTCGADLNLEDCGCASDAGASPFAGLKDLLGGSPAQDGSGADERPAGRRT